MGFGGISLGSLILIFLIIILLFGSKKLSSLAEDLGKAIGGFKKSLHEAEKIEQKPEDTDSNKK